MAKNSLGDSLRSLSNKSPVKEVPVPVTVAEPLDKGPHYRPSRDGTKAITAHADPAVSKQLKQLALDQDTNVQALVLEGVNLLFEKYGLPQIAPDRDKGG